MKTYTLKYNFLILLLRLACIVGFGCLFVTIIYDVISNGLHVDSSLLHLFIFLSVPAFILYRLFKRLLTESNFIRLHKNEIEIYNLVKFKKQSYKTSDCIFFHSSRMSSDQLILKIPTGKYVHILSYDYFDFKKLEKIFIDHGISKEGYLSDITT